MPLYFLTIRLNTARIIHVGFNPLYEVSVLFFLLLVLPNRLEACPLHLGEEVADKGMPQLLLGGVF